MPIGHGLELARDLVKALLPLLRPVFAWNHHAVMRAGAHGLSRHLAAPLIACAAG